MFFGWFDCPPITCIVPESPSPESPSPESPSPESPSPESPSPGVEVHYEIQEKLSVALNEKIFAFIQAVENVSVGPFMVAIGGGDDGAMGTLQQTIELRSSESNFSDGLVQILEHAGERYFYNAKDGSVVTFDALNLDSAMKTSSFGSFGEFLSWVFNEAKDQANDDRFAI